MEFCLKKLFIFFIFLSILTLSAVNASDTSNTNLIDDADANNLIDNSDYIPQETCEEDLTKETVQQMVKIL